MRIAVVGGGFTGLSCALTLLENNTDVVVFEESKTLGGLAGGFNPGEWRWNLEFFYHHVFTNDKEITALAKKVGWPVMIKSPVTTSFIEGKEIQLDSPISVLKFTKISLLGRVRMGAGLALLKIIPNGLFLEKYRVVEMLPKLIGREGYQIIWEKLLKAKFGPYAESVNMAWFWTRVAKRTKNLGYFEEGFQKLADKTGEKIVEMGGKIILDSKVDLRKPTDKPGMIEGKWVVNGEEFDGVVMTTPAPITEKLMGREIWPKIDYLWGQTLVLELNHKMIEGYWMNILEDGWPFLVTVEHTNMINKKYYDDNRVLYLGNYLPDRNKQLKMTKEELLELYIPYLKKINKQFKKKWIKNTFLFRKPFAQPVFPVNYSSKVPQTKTDQKGLYLANMSMVYPFDRGTNYAVKMGNDVAKQILTDLK
jgi:protoporphyrinogen oxidase